MFKFFYKDVQALLRLGPLKYVYLKVLLSVKKGKIKFNYKGNKIVLRARTSDFEVFRQVFFRNVSWIKMYLSEEPKVIVDLGSNNGLSMLSFGNIFRNSKIIGVEPDKSNYEISKENTSSLIDVFIENKAIWNKTTRINLFSPGTGKYSLNVIDNGSKIGEVDTITMNELIAKYQIEKIDILKIDVEGAEVELFNAGTIDWLRLVKLLIIETHDRKRRGCTESLFKAIASYRFNVFWKGESFVIEFFH